MKGEEMEKNCKCNECICENFLHKDRSECIIDFKMMNEEDIEFLNSENYKIRNFDCKE